MLTNVHDASNYNGDTYFPHIAGPHIGVGDDEVIEDIRLWWAGEVWPQTVEVLVCYPEVALIGIDWDEDDRLVFIDLASQDPNALLACLNALDARQLGWYV